MLTILLSGAYAIVAFPVGLVAGIRQARYNARIVPDEYDEDWPAPPLVSALLGGALWLPWLACYAVFRFCRAGNALLEHAAGTDKIVNASKLETLEREVMS